MNSIVERLRGLDTFGYQSQLACEAADLIKQQAAKIAELEAELNEQVAAATEYVNALTYARCELTFLRQRIDDAPVVAWKRIRGTGSPVATEDYLKAWPGIRSEFPIPLISKEDLL